MHDLSGLAKITWTSRDQANSNAISAKYSACSFYTALKEKSLFTSRKMLKRQGQNLYTNNYRCAFIIIISSGDRVCKAVFVLTII